MAYGLSRIKSDLRQYGPIVVAGDITLRSVNRIMYLKVLNCLKVDTLRPEFLRAPAGYTGRYLDEPELRSLCDQPEWELSEQFLDQAFAKKDRCYGFLKNDQLAAYQWYSTKPTNTDWRGMVANFRCEYVYMYKGFTHPRHRGRKLYPIGVTIVLSHYLAEGYRGFLSIVEANNFASMNACHDMGYTDIGKIRIAAMFDRCLLHADPACSAYGLRLTKPE